MLNFCQFVWKYLFALRPEVDNFPADLSSCLRFWYRKYAALLCDSQMLLEWQRIFFSNFQWEHETDAEIFRMTDKDNGHYM